ncbi:ammonium transporter [Opitutus sp. ER46]|uniref:ammonium transporter n=1 Tax=Opitutus sp. ER46 TaxID=2161864 RepID=UPI000D31E5C6|nr:ammonium transporter [Opitutus sp. ER46]PTX94594.1 ammonia permease [Opitutus sp. ER46]
MKLRSKFDSVFWWKTAFAVAALAGPTLALAADAAGTPAIPKMSDLSDLRVAADTVWVLVAAMLVFWMNAGFALVESGLCQSKNCTNILAKNFIVFAASTISYWVVGWGLMFGDGTPWVGTSGLWFVGGADNSPAVGAAYAAMNPFSTEKYAGVYGAINWTAVPLWAKFFFQLVFAGTAATIVSGAVAERIKFGAFLIFSFLLVAFVYPVSGHWIWGGGFLSAGNFRDFAGSTVVHSVGGWAALAGVIVLGPRLGKYRDGKVHPIPGHNMTSAALGVLILWLGWFGFNPGSTMSAGNGKAIAHILVATNMAAATGSLSALVTAWLLLKKPDFSMILNGCLAGLVAVTAPCAFVTVGSSAIIGLIAGVLVVLAVVFFDKVKLDDPVGALSVHLVNGVFGTLALGLFYNYDIASTIAALPPVGADGQVIPAEKWGVLAQTLVQLKGIAVVGVFVFIVSLVLWFLLKATMGIRVSAEEEREGLDIGEHGNEAYPDFSPAHK